MNHGKTLQSQLARAAEWLRTQNTLLLILAYLIAAVFLHRHTLHFGFNSDAFSLFEHARKGLMTAVSWDHSEHFMPLTSLWTAFQYRCFGLHQETYEIFNILQHGLIAAMVSLLALRLGLQRFQALLSGFLFLCAGSAYQVAFWSIVGNNYFVSTFLYLLTLLVLLRPSTKTKAAWSCAMIYALALLAHEQSVSLLPACFLASFWLKAPSNQPPRIHWKHDLRRGLVETLPMAIPLTGFLLMKYVMSLQTEILGPRRAFSSHVSGLSSGIFQLWTFRGDGLVGSTISSCLDIQRHQFAWIAVTGLVVILLYPRLSATSRFLLLWSSGHLLMMQFATGISIRHLYIPTTAAAIATINVLSGTVSRLLSTFRNNQLFSSGVLLVLVSLILTPSLIDLEIARNEWQATDRMTKNTFRSVGRISRPGSKISTLLIINADKEIFSPSFEIPCFNNGLRHLVRLASEEKIPRVLLGHTAEHFNNANGSVLITMQEVARLLTDKKIAALRIDDVSGQATRLGLKELRKQGLLRVAKPWVEMANPATRPELLWIRNRQHAYILIPPLGAVQTTLTPATREQPWFLISWMKAKDRQFELQIGTALHREVQSNDSGRWEYNLEALPDLHTERIRIPITIRNTDRRPLRISSFGFFTPRPIINVKTAPEFSWDQDNRLELPVRSELKLPVPLEFKDHYLQIVYSGKEERGFEVRLPSGAQIRLKPQGQCRVPWTTAWAALPQTNSIVITSIGTEAALIQQVWFSLPEDFERLFGK